MLTQTPSQTLTYRCPHCRTMVQVESSADGAVVNCPAPGCGKPFRVEIPVAKPVTTPVQPGTAASPDAVPLVKNGLTAGVHELARNEEPLPVTTPGNEPEEVVRTFHLSMFRRYPWRCLGYLLIIAASLAATVWVWMHNWEWMHLITLTVTAVVVIRLGLWWLRMHRSTLTITNKRAILKTGIFTQNTATIELEQLADYHVHQSLLMRWLNVGDLAIVSAQPQEQQMVIMALPDPGSATSILEPHLEARKKALAAAEGTAGAGASVVTAPEPVKVG